MGLGKAERGPGLRSSIPQRFILTLLARVFRGTACFFEAAYTVHCFSSTSLIASCNASGRYVLYFMVKREVMLFNNYIGYLYHSHPSWREYLVPKLVAQDLKL